jgi:hypothetical protein
MLDAGCYSIQENESLISHPARVRNVSQGLSASETPGDQSDLAAHPGGMRDLASLRDAPCLVEATRGGAALAPGYHLLPLRGSHQSFS